MFKKVICALVAGVILAAVLASCSINEGESTTAAPSAAAPTAEATTTKPALFEGSIPEYEFENYVDTVVTDTTYTFNVQCSRDEYDEYIQQIINCGFVNGTTQSENEYYGETASGYTASVNYNGTSLLAYFTK